MEYNLRKNLKKTLATAMAATLILISSYVQKQKSDLTPSFSPKIAIALKDPRTDAKILIWGNRIQ